MHKFRTLNTQGGPGVLGRPEQIYFETQRGAQCGLHALNNAIGRAWQTEEDMHFAVKEYLERAAQEGSPELRSLHVAPGGWYSSEILAQAITSTSMNRVGKVEYCLSLASLREKPELLRTEGTVGAIMNINNEHWVALRCISAQIWYLDSQLARPRKLSEKDYIKRVRKSKGAYCIKLAEDMKQQEAGSV